MRQTTSENADARQDSGRTGPVLEALDRARERWVAAGDPTALRRELLEVLRRLEGQ
jgi:hypothetical protein